jgi:hypothetical protein
MNDHDDPDELPDSAVISEARRLAAIAVMLIEHPKIAFDEGNSGLYGTAKDCAELILHLVQRTERCSDAAEFDALLYLIRCHAEGLGWTLSLLQIP